MKIKSILYLFLITILLMIVSCNSSNNIKFNKPDHIPEMSRGKLNIDKEKLAVVEQLRNFERVYLIQDPMISKSLENLFSTNKDVEVIYGCAEKPHTVGWCRGYDEIKKMMTVDSECWSKICIDYNNTLVDVDNNTAWVSTMGEAELTPQYLEKFKKFTNDITRSIEADNQVDDSIAPSVLKIMMDVLYVKSKEGKLELPFVLTIVYVKEKDAWLIRQMHFSYPIDPRGLDDISEIQEL